MTEPKTPDSVAVQPALPTLELPEFEGIRPVGVVTRVNGTGQRIARAMHIDERVVLVVEAEVADVGHGRTADGVKRVHKLTVLDVYELEGKPGAQLLRSLRAAHKIASDRRDGKEPLGGELEQPDPTELGIEVVVDGAVVLTTTEAAERRGEIVPGLPIVDVAVLVFEDGTRALWPDDWSDVVGPHPEAGERLVQPGAKKGAEPSLVVQILDPDTGETVEEWTAEDEAARLAELEAEAMAAEARADAEAVAELEAGRADADVVVDDGDTGGDPGICRGCSRGVGRPHLKTCSLLAEAAAAVATEDPDPVGADEPAPAGAAGPFDGPDDELDADDPDLIPPPAYYRIERADGSVEEVVVGDPIVNPVGPGDRVISVDVEGNEAEVVPDPEPVEAAVVERVIVEDADGFADVVEIPTSPALVALLDGTVGVVKNRIHELGDRNDVLLVRAIEAKGKNRKGVLEAADHRAAELFSDDVPRQPVPAGPGAFEPPEDAPELDEFENPEDV